MPVYFRGGKLNAFTVIRAQVPSEGDWTDGPEVRIKRLRPSDPYFPFAGARS